MVSLTSRHTKVILRGILFISLLTFFVSLYLESALKDFAKARTTIAQSQEVVNPDQPVLVACPDPPFKPSFFKDNGIGFNPYFWVKPNEIRNKLEKGSSMVNVFMSMSYKPGIDWNISISNKYLSDK